MTVRSGTSEGSTGILLSFDQNRPQNNNYNAVLVNTGVTTPGSGTTGMSVETIPAQWASPGSVLLEDLVLELRNPELTATALRLDARSRLTARRLYIDSTSGVGLDVVRSHGTISPQVMYPTIRIADAGIGVRRVCDQGLDLYVANLWYVNLLPSPNGRLVKEVAGAGGCTPLRAAGLGGIQDTARLELLSALHGMVEVRGTTQPFPCPGSGGAGLGTHWTNTTAGTASVNVCTSTGWRQAQLAP